MFAKPQQEHNCEMSDGTKSNASGNMSCRSLGGMWLICESSGESPDGEWSSIMTLGFDPAQNQFVGTFVGSMMANIWPYQGVLDAKARMLGAQHARVEHGILGAQHDVVCSYGKRRGNDTKKHSFPSL